MHRRISVLLYFTTGFLVFSGFILYRGFPQYSTSPLFKIPTTYNAPEETTSGLLKTEDDPANHDEIASTIKSDKPLLHVTITETGGSHDEVVAALVHSFGSQPDVLIDLYQLSPRYGIANIMKNFSLSHELPNPRNPDQFKSFGMENRKPDLFVAGTCELDILKFKNELQKLLDEGRTYMYCVVHHADRWAHPKLEHAVLPWVQKGLIEFWTLSPHTAKFLKEQSITKWDPKSLTGILPSVRHYVPLFPVNIPQIDIGGKHISEELAFGMQGDYDPARRDYASIFKGLAAFLDTKESLIDATGENITMHLLGHGPHPSVPEAIKSHVIFDERLSYIDYYSILSHTFALIPGFATEQYLDRKASSSVPAALIAGTPLVATQSILDAYSYLTKDVVWLQRDGESDLSVIGRILHSELNEITQKRNLVRGHCAQIIQSNIDRLGQWISEIKPKLTL